MQAEAIPLAVSGRDVLVVSQTGSGKTLMFLLPIMQRLAASAEAEAAVGAGCDATAVVLAPTAALAGQHMAVARQLAASLPTPPAIGSLESLDLDLGLDAEDGGSPRSHSRSRSRSRSRARLLIGTPECWLAQPGLGLGSSSSSSTSTSSASRSHLLTVAIDEVDAGLLLDLPTSTDCLPLTTYYSPLARWTPYSSRASTARRSAARGARCSLRSGTAAAPMMTRSAALAYIDKLKEAMTAAGVEIPPP